MTQAFDNRFKDKIEVRDDESGVLLGWLNRYEPSRPIFEIALRSKMTFCSRRPKDTASMRTERVTVREERFFFRGGRVSLLTYFMGREDWEKLLKSEEEYAA